MCHNPLMLLLLFCCCACCSCFACCCSYCCCCWYIVFVVGGGAVVFVVVVQSHFHVKANLGYVRLRLTWVVVEFGLCQREILDRERERMKS